jgi:peptide chain release factor 1
VLSDPDLLRKLNRERNELEPLVAAFASTARPSTQDPDDQEAMLDDPELGDLAREELPELDDEAEALESTIRSCCCPKDPNDERNTLIEIRSGEGGEEAALFAADVFRMYRPLRRVEALARSRS